MAGAAGLLLASCDKAGPLFARLGALAGVVGVFVPCAPEVKAICIFAPSFCSLLSLSVLRSGCEKAKDVVRVVADEAALFC